MSHLVCLGLGYTADALARRLAADGWRITGTARSADGAALLAAQGWTGIVFDGTAPSPALVAALEDATHVLASIPTGAHGDPALVQHAAALATAPLAWIGYLSTVGVYGDHGGAEVDETSACRPVSERGRRRLEAEAAWLELGRATGRRVEVFRLPGIYGPGRSALDGVRAGTARRIVKPGQIFNRVHVEDIATSLATAIAKPPLHRVYNVTDDAPGPPQDVIAFAAQLLGLPPPPEVAFADAHLSPMAVSFWGELKRVSNRRLRHDLGVTLAYPSYREGLAAILASERGGRPTPPRRSGRVH